MDAIWQNPEETTEAYIDELRKAFPEHLTDWSFPDNLADRVKKLLNPIVIFGFIAEAGRRKTMSMSQLSAMTSIRKSSNRYMLNYCFDYSCQRTREVLYVDFHTMRPVLID